MPRSDFARAVETNGFGLEHIDAIRRRFGTSFEATAYRLATTSRLRVAGGLFVYRYAKADIAAPAQGALFPAKSQPPDVTPKYRRHSFHSSGTYPTAFTLPWNKSLPEGGAAYRAARSGKIESDTEELGARGKYRAQGRPLQCDADCAPHHTARRDGFSEA